MPFIDWEDLTETQKAEVLVINPNRYENFTTDHTFWVKKDGSMSRKKGHVGRLSRAGNLRYEKLNRQIRDEMMGLGKSHVKPEKGDLEAWKPGVVFHFSKG